MKLCLGLFLVAQVAAVQAFVPQARSGWVTERRTAPQPRFLFGGADEAPKSPPSDGSAPAPGGISNAEEEMALAMEWQKKFAERANELLFEGTADGVTVKIAGNSQPEAVVVSEDAMKGGATKVGAAVVTAYHQAKEKNVKGIQELMVTMQKELMEDLQKREAAGK